MASAKHVRFYIAAVLLLVVGIEGGRWLWRRATLPPADIRHVVLISIDTCRADYLSCYGYDAPTTPNIDAVAAEGTLFENVIAPVSLDNPPAFVPV